MENIKIGKGLSVPNNPAMALRELNRQHTKIEAENNTTILQQNNTTILQSEGAEAQTVVRRDGLPRSSIRRAERTTTGRSGRWSSCRRRRTTESRAGSTQSARWGAGRIRPPPARSDRLLVRLPPRIVPTPL